MRQDRGPFGDQYIDNVLISTAKLCITGTDAMVCGVMFTSYVGYSLVGVYIQSGVNKVLLLCCFPADSATIMVVLPGRTRTDRARFHLTGRHTRSPVHTCGRGL